VSDASEAESYAVAAPRIPFSLHFEDAPRSIARSAKKFSNEEIKGSRLKLLAAWCATIEFILEELALWQNDEYSFMPGFVFGEPLGMHQAVCVNGVHGHVLYINPIDNNGSMRVTHNDVGTLYAIALHECAHILRRYHDETYVSYLTELTSRTAAELPELKMRIRIALAKIKPACKRYETIK
jgi:hypothetical protein